MIKNILTIAAALIATHSAIAAPQKKTIDIKDVKIEKVGDKLNIRFSVDVSKNRVKGNYKLTLTPTLYNGNEQQVLKPIVVDSRRVRIVEYRKGLQPISEVVYAEQRKLIEYATTLPYQKWMNGSSLRLDKRVAGCCREQLQRPELLASNLVFMKPIVPYIEPPKSIEPQISEVQRHWDFSNSDMIVDYEAGKTSVNPFFFDNRKTLTELVGVISKLYTGENVSINKIEITGYSSPEGASVQNSKFAMQRAVSLKDYLQREVKGLSDSLFQLKNGGENWSGLRKAVADSYMPERTEVLYIIDNVPAEINYKTNSSRKKALMDFKGGCIWNYMFKTFFSQLRNACYIVVYYDKLKDTASDEINRAIEMVNDKQYDNALTMLLPLKEDARAWNTIGVCYMMNGSFTEAKQYLQKAVENGNEQAKQNLNEIIERE